MDLRDLLVSKEDQETREVLVLPEHLDLMDPKDHVVVKVTEDLMEILDRLVYLVLMV